MLRFTQKHAVYDQGTLNLHQRAYDDFRRDAANELRPLRRDLAPKSFGHVIGKGSRLLAGDMARRRAMTAARRVKAMELIC